MAYTISLEETGRFWQVFEDGNVRTSFDSQEDAELWCNENGIKYKVK